MEWTEFLSNSAFKNTDLTSVLFNLALVLVFGQILAWHYVRFSPVLSNKRKLARIFVFISATTMLVISVVQTSLALSLGLVGALSIIRFRTPIKEPEELAYLFLAIGLGLGLGANEGGVTLLIFAAILVYMALMSVRSSKTLPPRVLVHVSGELQAGGGSAESALREILKQAEEGASRVDLRRVDSSGSAFNATLALDVDGPDQVGLLLSRIEGVLPGGSISVVEGSSLD